MPDTKYVIYNWLLGSAMIQHFDFYKSSFQKNKSLDIFYHFWKMWLCCHIITGIPLWKCLYDDLMTSSHLNPFYQKGGNICNIIKAYYDFRTYLACWQSELMERLYGDFVDSSDYLRWLQSFQQMNYDLGTNGQILQNKLGPCITYKYN